MSYPKIIIDTNKILAAALKHGKIRTILYQAPLKLLTPRQAIEEIEKHARQLARKAKMSTDDFLILIEKIIEDRITLEEARKLHVLLAKTIAEEFDPGDAPFIALALQHNAPIWTNDHKLIKHSHKTRKYTAIDTEGVEMLLEGVPIEKVKERMWEKYGDRI